MNKTKASRLLLVVLALMAANAANAAVTLTALDTGDLAAVCSWLIAGVISVFGVKATPVVVTWGVGKLASFLGRH